MATEAEKEAAKAAKEAEKEAAKAAKAASAKESVTVHFGGISRIYTKAEHGDDFEVLARGFAKKTGGTVELDA
jgi:membrane protein involved in colicin uptake